MKQTGLLLTCDRCGKEYFILDDGTGNQALIRYHNSSWRNLDDKDICPSCYEEYKQVKNEFWDYKKEETE